MSNNNQPNAEEQKVSRDIYNVLGMTCPYCESGNRDVKYGQGKHTHICTTCGAEFRIILLFMATQVEEKAISKALNKLPHCVFYEWDRH